mgnify:CR=1 FL=1
MLSDVDIKKALKEKLIQIDPLEESYIQPSSIDLKVGADFRVFENHKYSHICLLYTSPSPRDGLLSRMPSSA